MTNRKSVLSTLLVLGILATVSVSSAQFRGDDRGGGRDDRGGRSRMQTIYQLSNGKDYMLSTVSSEARREGYRQVATVTMFADAGRSRVALYRCLVPAQGHFASADPGCEGQRSEGVLGFMERAPTNEARQALVRCISDRTGAHLITDDSNQCRRDFRIEGTLGYVP